MSAAWKIENVSELRRLATGPVGFVVDPFNRRWHRSTCARVGAMTLGEPKWFAADRPALDRYLQARAASYPTAKPIEACLACAGRGSQRAIGEPAEEPPARLPRLEVQAVSHQLVVRSDTRVSFGPKRGSAAHVARTALQDRLAELSIREGELLHAAFAGSIPGNSDVENQLLYNVFDARANRLLARGVRFELAPATGAAGVEYRYASAESGAAFTHWVPGTVAAEWSEQPIVSGHVDRLLARVWWTLRRASAQTLVELPPDARFCAAVRVGVPAGDRGRIARTDRIKNLVDGIVSAFQQHEASAEACGRIAAGLGIDEVVIAGNLRDDVRAVLGDAERPIGLTQSGVQWNPDDTRLVAAELVLKEHGKSAWTVAGSLAHAEPRS